MAIGISVGPPELSKATVAETQGERPTHASSPAHHIRACSLRARAACSRRCWTDRRSARRGPSMMHRNAIWWLCHGSSHQTRLRSARRHRRRSHPRRPALAAWPAQSGPTTGRMVERCRAQRRVADMVRPRPGALGRVQAAIPPRATRIHEEGVTARSRGARPPRYAHARVRGEGH